MAFQQNQIKENIYLRVYFFLYFKFFWQEYHAENLQNYPTKFTISIKKSSSCQKS